NAEYAPGGKLARLVGPSRHDLFGGGGVVSRLFGARKRLDREGRAARFVRFGDWHFHSLRHHHDDYDDERRRIARPRRKAGNGGRCWRAARTAIRFGGGGVVHVRIARRRD